MHFCTWLLVSLPSFAFLNAHSQFKLSLHIQAWRSSFLHFHSIWYFTLQFELSDSSISSLTYSLLEVLLMISIQADQSSFSLNSLILQSKVWSIHLFLKFLFFTSIQSDHSSVHFEPSDSSISRSMHLLLPQASILQSHSSCHVIFQFELSDSFFKFEHMYCCLTLKFCA